MLVITLRFAALRMVFLSILLRRINVDNSYFGMVGTQNLIYRYFIAGFVNTGVRATLARGNSLRETEN